MNSDFKKGFLKAASHVLSEQAFDMDNSESQRERQQILEDSYNREQGKPERIVKKDKLIKEESTRSGTGPYLIERF